MDILAGIEATSTANSSLKQYMVTVNQLATATGLSPADLATSNTLGAALQALANNSIGNFIPMLSAGQSVPNIGSLNPIVVAAAAALSEQNAKSMFSNAQPLALSLAPMANFNELSNVLHSQLGQSHAPAEQHPKKEEQNVPTLVSLLASASVGTPQRQSSPRQRQMANSSVEKQTPTQPPPTKRSRLSQNAAQKEKLCERSKAFFGTSTDSEFPSAPAPSVGSPSGTKVPLTASLLSALTGVSAKFPLSAASPPVLPSPPQNSAQNSPTTSNTLVRRLSSVSASSSSTNGTGKTFGQTAMAIPTVKPRTPQRKPAAPIPNEKKDPAYFERRRKNNDAAKRSRDMRRQKEEQTAQRAAYLEQENIQLRKRVEMLSADLAKHRAILLSIAAPLTPPNSTVPFLTKSPPPEASVGEQRHCHVLASPTATKTMDGECHPLPRAVATVETEGHQIRLMKRERSETPTEDEGKCRAESDSAGEATAGENAPDHSLH